MTYRHPLATVKFATRVTRVLPIFFLLSLLLVVAPEVGFAKDEPKWIEVHTSHFSVVTDAGDKRGREVALRMEQMRAVFGQLILKDKLKMSVPVTVVALKSNNQYGLVAPLKQNHAAALYVPGADRVYIVLDLFQPDPWLAVAHPLAHYLLNYNYPPTQGWFDEGLAEYFGSIYIGRQVELGGDPELMPEWHDDIFDNGMQRDSSLPQSLTQLVSSPVWMSMVDLFNMKHDPSGTHEGTHNTLFYAQSWMVVHYLINKNKLPEAGTYFDLVLNQKVPVDKAMVQAFDMSPQQMEDAVKAYFKSLSGLGIALDQAKKPVANPVDMQQPDHLPLPFIAEDIGITLTPMKDEEANAVIADVMARIPEHRDQALHDLHRLTEDPKDNDKDKDKDNEAARRALAWDDISHKQYDAAANELEKATDLNPRDPWIWYYRSVLKYRKAQATRQEMQGLANMMQDLRAVTDWYPDLADAYNMLGIARVEGGGINSALEAQRLAISLAPRNVEYQFNLGQIYVAGKKWELARQVFTRLKEGTDRAAAAAAKQQLEDLDTLQKYGVRPQRAAGEAPAGAASTPSAGTSTAAVSAKAGQNSASSNQQPDQDEDDDAPPKPTPVKPGTTGPMQFLKGKIVSSDCSKPPEATVTILSGMTTYRMHASDYKSLVVIGQDQFSCDWKNLLVSVNYRAVGKNGGELVSIEVR
jgi:tetratricopeptide (TPR) repeat protein